MRPNRFRSWACVLPITLILTAGCSRAPSFDILGSFFPAWMVCVAIGVVLTAAARWLLMRLRIPIAAPVLTYPCLAALFALISWLALFR